MSGKDGGAHDASEEGRDATVNGSDAPDDGLGASALPSPDIEWNDLAAFLAVARHGGLSGAARAIASSPPTLGRRMRALERSLGRELFIRRRQGYDLTDEGARLREALRGVETGIARATLPQPGEELPLVKLSAGSWTMHAMIHAMDRIVGDPPDLRVRLVQEEDVVSIRRRQADIGFRLRRPTEEGLAGRKLRRVEFAPYALPVAPDRWIVVRSDTPSARWVLERCCVDVAIETTAPRLALDLALAGMGRAVLPTFIGDLQGDLERVGEAIPELAHDQWIVSHADDRNLPHIRTALDRLGEVFG